MRIGNPGDAPRFASLGVITLSQRAQQLVLKPLLAVIGTLRPSGGIELVPAWFEYRDGFFWVNSAKGRAWPRNLERDRRVTLLIVDKQDDHYWAQVEGRVNEATTEGADAHINRLSLRYSGKDYTFRPGMVRIMFTIEPLRITGEKLD